MKKALCLTLDEDMVEHIEKLADKEGRSLSGMINELLKQQLAKKPKK
jgi:hypothetical protein